MQGLNKMLRTCCYVFLVLVMALGVNATTGNLGTDWAGDWKATRRVRTTDTVSIMFIFQRSQAQLQQLDAVRIIPLRSMILQSPTRSDASIPHPLSPEKITAIGVLGGIRSRQRRIWSALVTKGSHKNCVALSSSQGSCTTLAREGIAGTKVYTGLGCTWRFTASGFICT